MKKSNRKPLRATTKNKTNDLHNAYLNTSGTREIPINSKTDEDKDKLEIDNELEEKELETIEENKNLTDNGEIEELKSKIKSLEIEKEELKDQLMRKTAEMDNMRRRSLKEKNELIDYANQGLLLKLLPLVDDFKKAIESGKSKHDYDLVMQGIEMIYQKMQKIFEESGVKQMEDPTGQPFNVDYHEAMLQMPSDDIEEGNVIQVIEPGFMFHDKVLRHAKVVTSSGKEE